MKPDLHQGSLPGILILCLHLSINRTVCVNQRLMKMRKLSDWGTGREEEANDDERGRQETQLTGDPTKIRESIRRPNREILSQDNNIRRLSLKIHQGIRFRTKRNKTEKSHESHHLMIRQRWSSFFGFFNAEEEGQGQKDMKWLTVSVSFLDSLSCIKDRQEIIMIISFRDTSFSFACLVFYDFPSDSRFMSCRERDAISVPEYFLKESNDVKIDIASHSIIFFILLLLDS